MIANKYNYAAGRSGSSGWFKFWHPAQSAALESEERQNLWNRIFNYKTADLDSKTSINLTSQDNAKTIAFAPYLTQMVPYIVVGIVIICIAIVLRKKI